MSRFRLLLLAGLLLLGLGACSAVPPATVALPATATATAASSETGSGAAAGPLPTLPVLAIGSPDVATPLPPGGTLSIPSSSGVVEATGTPEAPGSDAGALGPGVAEQIDALFAEWDRPESPGCSLALGQAGKVVYGRGYGLADLQHGVPITAETVFNTGSIAKQVTGLSIELLREEGRLQLDDNLQRYVPELPAYAGNITLRQMLAHTSGLRDDRTLALMAGMADDELLSESYLLNLIFRQQDTNFPPGQQFSYSNSNFSLLALVVQRVSGRPLAQFAAEHLFRPLGMGHTRFAADPMALGTGRALAYARAGGSYVLSLPNAALPGPTNLYTTAADLLRWADNYSTARAGTREGLAAVLQPAHNNQGGKVAYNFGLEQHTYRDLGPTLAHDGVDGGFRSELLFWPEQRRSVAVLCNLEDVDAEMLAVQAARLWLDLPALTPTPQPTPRPTVPGEPGESYVTLSAANLAGLAGVYYDPDGTHLLRLSVDGSRLRAEGLPELEFAALAADRFRIFSGGSLTSGEATFPATGSALEIQNTRSFNGSYRRYPDLAAGSDTYSGTYYSPELDATYRISVKNGILTLDSRRFVDIDLLPLDDHTTGDGTSRPTLFEMAEALPAITVAFTPASGAPGRIIGFDLSLDRAQRVHFDRQP